MRRGFALRQAGRQGYRDSIRNDIRLATLLHQQVDRHPEFEACTLSLSIATFRYVPEDLQPDAAGNYLDELNKALLVRLQKGGRRP